MKLCPDSLVTHAMNPMAIANFTIISPQLARTLRECEEARCLGVFAATGMA